MTIFIHKMYLSLHWMMYNDNICCYYKREYVYV